MASSERVDARKRGGKVEYGLVGDGELDEGKVGIRETPPTRSTREFHLQSKYCRNANTLVLVVALLHWYWSP